MGLFIASLETIRLPDSLPATLGINATCIVQLSSEAKAKPQVPPPNITKSGFEVRAVMLNIGALPVLMSVTVPTVEEPISTVPKESWGGPKLSIAPTAVGVGEAVLLGVTVGVGVLGEVEVGVSVGVAVRVAVGVAVAVAVGVLVAVAVAVAVRVAVAVAVTVAVAVRVAFTMAVEVGVGVAGRGLAGRCSCGRRLGGGWHR